MKIALVPALEVPRALFEACLAKSLWVSRLHNQHLHFKQGKEAANKGSLFEFEGGHEFVDVFNDLSLGDGCLLGSAWREYGIGKGRNRASLAPGKDLEALFMGSILRNNPLLTS